MNAFHWGMPILAGWFTGVFSDLDPSKRFALLVVVVGCGTGVLCTLITSITGAVNSYHHRRVEADMKREMIERGMSADEIAKVVEAAMPPDDGPQRWITAWAKCKKRS